MKCLCPKGQKLTKQLTCTSTTCPRGTTRASVLASGINEWLPASVGNPESFGRDLRTTASYTTIPYKCIQHTAIIDGNLEDWDGLELVGQPAFTGLTFSGGLQAIYLYPLNSIRPSQTTLFDTNYIQQKFGNWTGEHDNSMSFALSWDVQHVYIAIKVIDDKHRLPVSNAFSGDSVTITITDAARTKRV
eukprot:COSAG05_NODE_5396_length_1188_cov_1.144169_1_plen_188_part_10